MTKHVSKLAVTSRLLGQVLLVMILFPVTIIGQIDLDEEAFEVKAFYDEILRNGKCYDWLHEMCTTIGPRLSGTPNAAAAVEYTRQVMEGLELDSVWLQPCVVPRWKRGEAEQCRIVNSAIVGTSDLRAVALGNSVGTGPDGLNGQVIEVQGIDELKQLADEDVIGRIVFFNRPMDPTLRRVFNAYGRAVDQRYSGPVEAARKGAVAAVVRSMTTELDDVPHTGSTAIDPDGFNIPSVAVSTNDADRLSSLLRRSEVELYIRTTCQMLGPVTSYNVIGQINGSERPNEIIAVGGHLDSWDLGQGAHDDGAGCMQAIEVMRAIKAVDYKPRRTIRCVMWMNEENGLAGGNAYAGISNELGEFHIAAIESDAGGFTPRGFTCDAQNGLKEGYLESIGKWWDVLAGMDLYLQPGGSGADISPLKSQGGLLFGLRPDSQRYFKYHHTADDTIETVNARELKLGASSIAGLLYMVDKYLERVSNDR